MKVNISNIIVRPRCALAERYPHRARRSRRIAPRTRLGNLHRCRHSHLLRSSRRDCVPALGGLCRTQGRPHRQCTPLHSHRTTPLTAFGLSWLLRFAAFLASQRLFGCAGRNAHPMVMRCSRG